MKQCAPMWADCPGCPYERNYGIVKEHTTIQHMEYSALYKQILIVPTDNKLLDIIMVSSLYPLQYLAESHVQKR